MEEASFILHAAGLGLAHLFTWPTFPMMMVGIGVGLFLGIIPGLGGLVGLSLLIPFAITMDPVVGLSFLLGMTAVITQSDTIPAVLIGVPGTSASMATALDGFPMAKRGEAGRALCAAYFAGIFGMMIAAVEFMMILPVLRSVILSFGQPEFFMLILFGLLLTGSLAGKSMLRRLIMALAGLLLAMVSNATSSGFVRYAGDIVYLWDGVPLIPVVLGMFAIPEVIDMARRGSPISEVTVDTRVSGVWAGFKDNVDNWWLVLKTSSLGAFVGFIPGLGSQVAEWMAYGAAISSDKDPESFGKGNVRGVRECQVFCVWVIGSMFPERSTCAMPTWRTPSNNTSLFRVCSATSAASRSAWSARMRASSGEISGAGAARPG